MDLINHCQGVKYAKKSVSYLLIILLFSFHNSLMSLLIRVFRSCLGCVFPHFKPFLGASISRVRQGLFLGFFCSFVSALLGNSSNHTVFLTESDVVMGTGDNQYGQLSVPVVLESSVPIQSKFGIREVASGGGHTMYLMWDGTVWRLGNNNYGQFGGRDYHSKNQSGAGA